MRDFVTVAIVYNIDHLKEKNPCVALCEVPFLFQPTEELASLAIAE
jgi:hypothetical protein